MRRLLAALMVAGLGVLAMAPGLRAHLSGMLKAAQVLKQEESQAEITLPAMTVYALQLGAYDNGEHAQAHQTRLQQSGIPCAIWQREQMRLVCDAAIARSSLDVKSAMGEEAWVVADALDEVTLRIRTESTHIAAAHTLLTLPDRLFEALGRGERELTMLIEETRETAQAAVHAHEENLLYTQLAQSLINWCALMEHAIEAYPKENAMAYARVTMCTLCSELRRVLTAQGGQSEESSASAQRTPSTAAEVMPPA